MSENFDEILDKCIDSIGSGDSIDDCLARYPEHASELLPLLKTVAGAQDAVPFSPSAEKKQAARQQLLAVMGTQKGRDKRPFLSAFFRKTKVWAGAAAMAAVALIAVFGVMPLLNNSGTPIQKGDFALMISDNPAIMSLFQSVEIEITSIELEHETEGWQDITPNITTVDLTLLQGDWAQQIWEGTLPVGNYTAVRAVIGNINAVLVIGDIEVSIDIPSAIELEIAIPFEITAGSLTNYVYDLTLSGEVDDYGLTPVPEESGPKQEDEFDLIVAP
ncbi:DUF4382 domain-containing protein [Chloroflexota bacterium]